MKLNIYYIDMKSIRRSIKGNYQVGVTRVGRGKDGLDLALETLSRQKS